MKLKTLSVLYVLMAGTAALANKPNVVFLTLDDLSRGSLGIYGCPLPEISPNLDRIGREGIRFNHFHVMASNCTPSRNHMMTGQYQQHNGVYSLGSEGAGNHSNRNTMPALFRAAGYHTGIMGKNPHQMPFEPHSAWDVEYEGYGSTKKPALVYEKTVQAIADAKRLGKPLFFNLNIFDPHVGWYGWDGMTGPVEEIENHPSRIYGPDEVPYPDFFPPIAKSMRVGKMKKSDRQVDMMVELAAYYNTVKRADDSVGQMLRAFEEAGCLDETVLLVISDHGMQQPGAKTTLYHEGSVSPLMIRWPGVAEPGAVNDTHMVGAIDVVPTFCELIGQPLPHDLDGCSFLPLVRGGELGAWRDFVYKQQNDKNRSRAIQTRKWLYIINFWADGTKRFGSVDTGMLCWRVLHAAADHPESDPLLKSWMQRMEYRCPEELFDIENDPQCLHNLADDVSYAETLRQMRALMLTEAEASGDTFVLEGLRNPRDEEVRAATVQRIADFQEENRNNPSSARKIAFDPFDGWMELQYTLFEPYGEWGGWKSGSEGVVLNDSDGHTDSGNSCVAFQHEGGRLETEKWLKGSLFSQLKIDCRIPVRGTVGKGKNAPATRGPTLSRASSLIFEYYDGKQWHELQRLAGQEIPGDHNLVFDAPDGGFPEKMKFGIRAELEGADQFFTLDALRFTGQQGWTVICSESFEDSPGGWTASRADALAGGELVLKDGTMLALTDAVDASALGIIELDYTFRGAGVGKAGRMVVEYYNGSGWVPIQTHAFNYVLKSGPTYAGQVTLRADELDFTPELRLRFSLKGSAEGSVHLDNVRMRSRRNAWL